MNYTANNILKIKVKISKLLIQYLQIIDYKAYKCGIASICFVLYICFFCFGRWDIK